MAALITCASDDALAPTPTGGGGGRELLDNPGLESGGARWVNSETAGREVSGRKSHQGTGAVHIAAAVSVGRTVYQEVAATQGKSYTASGWVATQALEGSGASVVLIWLDTLGLSASVPSGHVLRTDPLDTRTGTTDWTRFFRTFTAPAGARAVRVALLLAPEGDGAGEAWFDDLSLLRDAPPSVTLTSPLRDDILHQEITLTADARDDYGIRTVEFRVNDQLVGSDTTPPFSIRYQTTPLANGSYSFTASADDSIGHVTVSAPIAAAVLNGSSPQGDVVVILTDDQRYDMMSAMPLTSALLSAETVRFEQAFVTTSLCCPSRTSILTGQYVHRHQITGNYLPYGGALKFPATSTIASWLHAVGYRTGLVGKYLNLYQSMSPRIPPGWDDFEGLLSMQAYTNDTINQNGVVRVYGNSTQDYITDVLARLATDFITTTPSSQPLFLYFTPIAPHSPAVPHPADVGRYTGYPNYRPPSFNEADVSDKPSWVQALPPITQQLVNRSDVFHRRQLETLQSVDRAVVAIVAALKASGRWDRTLLIFMSDNGMTWGEHRIRDTKYCAYEECIRVPLWIRAPGLQARTDSSIVANIDLAPTIAAWGGFLPPGVVNGRNLLPLLTSPGTPWRTSLLIEHQNAGTPPTPDSHGVRTARYLYNEFSNGERELYDLWTDPWELDNLAGDPANAALIVGLKAELDRMALE